MINRIEEHYKIWGCRAPIEERRKGWDGMQNIALSYALLPPNI